MDTGGFGNRHHAQELECHGARGKNLDRAGKKCRWEADAWKIGASLLYIRSAVFLRGDGRVGNVVWVDSALHGRSAGCSPQARK